MAGEASARGSAWVEVAGEADVPAGTLRAANAAGHAILLARVDGLVVAVEAECSHEAYPLLDGDLDGCLLTCTAHYSVFDLRDGSVVEPPAEQALRTFATRLNGGRIEVLVP